MLLLLLYDSVHSYGKLGGILKIQNKNWCCSCYTTRYLIAFPSYLSLLLLRISAVGDFRAAENQIVFYECLHDNNSSSCLYVVVAAAVPNRLEEKC
ncbi:hypothetical protein QVD17_07026 [Tagetes erecta]|uniref:Uncharacterized protein n=1 Tax=Tagetes erecta TaxID=13708 RepID=A0AAD8LLR6_TARER|nr:hypothetical protein QVD17_06924 [Tagetes erecta]KAK1441161.1 hypothetical protein QVD17_07000 [Tagetes erecta]KAK1441186.1 hypothetical protein QVD17_07026 [Tagetes erecta]